jgi:hypothetical protein
MILAIDSIIWSWQDQPELTEVFAEIDRERYADRRAHLASGGKSEFGHPWRINSQLPTQNLPSQIAERSRLVSPCRRTWFG